MIRTVKIMVILGLLALCGTAWCVEPIPNLIAHWKFDEGSGTTAYDSFGDNHGTVYGAVWTTGQVDGALDFDGVDDYVDLDAHIGDFQNLSTGTVSVWIKKEGTGSSGGAIFSASDGGDIASTMYFAKLYDERIKIRIAENDTSKLKWMSDSNLPFGWHHFVYTTNFSGNWIYLDGEPITGSYTVGSPSTNAFFNDVTQQDNLRIGHIYINNEAVTHWNGTIDDVRIYDRALSAEEVQQLYQDGLCEVIELEIVGPDEVAENFSASYKAIAHYDNDSTKDVTDSADWQVEPNSVASIEAGLLTTEEIYVPQEDITIYAQYTEGNVTVEAEKEVLVFAICPSGSALSFDGDDDYVDLDAHIGDFQNLSTGALSVWIKEEGTGISGPFFSASDSGDVDSRLTFIKLADGRIIVRISQNGTSKVYWTSTNAVPSGWHHFVYTTDSSGHGIYLDGEPITGSYTVGSDSTNAFFNDVTQQDTLRIGMVQSGWVGFYGGTIDEVAIYDRALSAEEIRANMHTRLQGDEPGLVGYWDFDEGEGQVVYDLSPYGNHGRLGSAPNPDVSDPAWVDSDAPIGICTNIALDIKPGSCPNPLNVMSKGILPVAILGSEEFDVNTIDVASVRLDGVAAIRHSYEDVADPVLDANECECAEGGPDGYIDLTLKFRTQEIVEQLIDTPGGLTDGQTLGLDLSGELFDDIGIAGSDCVVLVGNVPKWLEAKRWDGNEDGIVNLLDLAKLAEYWLQSTVE